MKTVNIHIKNEKNIGDSECSVSKYYKLDCITDDITNWKSHSNGNVIFGGGMLLKKIRQQDMLNSIKGKKIGWSIGNSNKHLKKYDYSKEKFIRGFDLLGSRDYGIGLRYVPCPSCKNTLFDREYKETEKVVAYTNKLSSDFKLDIPTMDNENSLCDVISFLGSAETIITSSYHGVYWGMLLNKKIICVPFNAKFYSFKYDVPMCTEPGKWKLYTNKTIRYDGFLEECRKLNDDFYNDVVDLI